MSGRLKHMERSHRNHSKSQRQMVDHSIKSAYRASVAKASKGTRREKKG